jgi:hypothetical protein
LGALAVALTVVLPSQSGCIFTIDSLTRLAPPESKVTTGGTSLPGRAGPSTRQVKLDREHGLVCATVDTSTVRPTSVETEALNPNGIKTLVILLTALEGTVFGLSVWKGDHHFQSPYYIVPVGLDVGWGIYRSFAIKPEIIRGTVVSVEDGEHAVSTVEVSTPCPVGTEVALSADGTTLVAHVGEHGWMLADELPALIAFLSAHASVDLANAGGAASAGFGVKFDAAAAADIVAAARRQQEEKEARDRAAADAAARANTPPPVAPPGGGPWPPPPYGRRAIVRLEPNGVPHVYGVVIDFPMGALCGGSVGCPAGQHCGDRGDGVPLCFGPGAIHPFCGAETDCPSGLCGRRPDGVGLCR